MTEPVHPGWVDAISCIREAVLVAQRHALLWELSREHRPADRGPVASWVAKTARRLYVVENSERELSCER